MPLKRHRKHRIPRFAAWQRKVCEIFTLLSLCYYLFFSSGWASPQSAQAFEGPTGVTGAIFGRRPRTAGALQTTMNHDILVRRTAEADLPAITAIYTEAVRAGPSSFELKAPDAGEMTRRWRIRVAKGLPHIVAVRDDAVVGYAYASRFRTSAAYRFMVEDSIYIAPDAQGAGFGRALLTELIKLCEGLGYRQMIALIAGGTENVASIRLHDHLGFRQVGLIEGSAFKHARWIDTLLMLRALGEGKASLPRDG